MPELMGKLDTLVNGPEGLPPFDGDAWDYADWRFHEEQVRRLRGRIFNGLLGPRARERACVVLRGPRCSNAPGLPGKSPNRPPRSRARLRPCCTVHSPVGWAVTPPTCIRRVPCSMNTSTYSLVSRMVST